MKAKQILSIAVVSGIGFFATGTGVAQQVSRDLVRDINSATQELAEGNVKAALEGFDNAAKTTADNYTLSYNRGIAFYRNGDIDSARTQFLNALDSTDQMLAAKSWFNLGNCDYSNAVALSEEDRAAAIKSLESAVQKYRRSLKLNSDDTDARVNIELAAKLMSQLQQQEEQEQEQQKQEEQQNDQQNQQQDQQQQSQDHQQSGSENSEPQDQSQQNQDQQSQDQAGKDPQNQAGEKNSESQKSQDQANEKSQQNENQSAKDSQEDSSQQDSGDSTQQDQAGERSDQSESASQDDKQRDQSGENQPNQDSANSQNEQQGEEETQQDQSDASASDGDQTKEEQGQPARQNVQDQQQDLQEQAERLQQQAREGEQSDPKDSNAGQRQHAAASTRPNQQSNDGEDGMAGIPNYGSSQAGSAEGKMDEHEAMKMLQSIRDRDLLRRYQKLRETQRRHIPVDRDW